MKGIMAAGYGMSCNHMWSADKNSGENGRRTEVG